MNWLPIRSLNMSPLKSIGTPEGAGSRGSRRREIFLDSGL